MTKRLGGGLAETTGERHLVAQEALKGLNSRDQMSEALRNYGDVGCGREGKGRITCLLPEAHHSLEPACPCAKFLQPKGRATN
ncbi:hypothetical protein C0Q70_08126 [Pomacea canaliculata]|uniref:Uncharacterized protein n=1 Tax=Pomacea canaliculata TaxID=400727 RepID=A0A2T7PGY9_POMCA|nr:hypothetical protein C0Q70_08126 [Pomacea canaliculata]